MDATIGFFRILYTIEPQCLIAKRGVVLGTVRCLIEINDGDTFGYRSFKCNIKSYDGPEHLISKEVFYFFEHRLRIRGPFVEKGGERIQPRNVSDLRLDEFDHSQELTDTHQSKGAHIDGDDDLVGGSQGIEGEEAEAGRTINDDVFVR